MNSGKRNQVIPGARIVCIVTMKFSPVRIDAKPRDEHAARRRHDLVLENMLLNGV